MTNSAVFLAVDLGASNGRLVAGRWNGVGFDVEELHRFPNVALRQGKTLCWNVPSLWNGVLEGLRKLRAKDSSSPVGIGVDAWGVDFGLLDDGGNLMGNPVHYRDARTQGMLEYAATRIDDFRFFHSTGVQPMAINTVYQLLSMIASGDRQLCDAKTLLSIPDLFQYLLCGEKRAEYTEATTTQLFDCAQRDWAWDLIETLQIRPSVFAPLCAPATILGPVQSSVLAECGFGDSFSAIAVASHDTASAVAAIPDLDPESVFLSCGTWSLMGTPVETAIRSAEAFRLGFTNEGAADGGALCLKNLTGLWILQECIRCWQANGTQSAWSDLQQAAAAATPFQTLIDTDAAEFQSPSTMDDEIAAWCRQTGQVVPQRQAEITRCILESLALTYRSTLCDLARVTGRKFNVVRLVGGGSRNSLLCQMTADACNCVVVAGPVEAAALGNLVAQAVSKRYLADFHEASKVMAGTEQTRRYLPKDNDMWQEAARRLDTIREARAASQNAAPMV